MLGCGFDHIVLNTLFMFGQLFVEQILLGSTWYFFHALLIVGSALSRLFSFMFSHEAEGVASWASSACVFSNTGKRPHADDVVVLCLSWMSGNCLAAGAAAWLLALAGSYAARSQSTVHGYVCTCWFRLATSSLKLCSSWFGVLKSV